jgi:importin-4
MRATVLQEAPLISKHIGDLINFFLTGGETQAYEPEVRCMSLNALLWTIR